MKALLFILLIILFPASANAHFLETSGDIGGVLHINPDDDPIVGQSANFYFDLRQRNAAFDFSNCSCSVTLTQDLKAIYSQQLLSSGNSSANFAYTFPSRAVYGLDLKGAPTIGSSFQPFTLHWDIRADRTSNAQSAVPVRPSWLVWLLVHGLHLLPFLGASGYVVYRAATNKKP